jgi:hypothetical protein
MQRMQKVPRDWDGFPCVPLKPLAKQTLLTRVLHDAKTYMGRIASQLCHIPRPLETINLILHNRFASASTDVIR